MTKQPDQTVEKWQGVAREMNDNESGISNIDLDQLIADVVEDVRAENTATFKKWIDETLNRSDTEESIVNYLAHEGVSLDKTDTDWLRATLTTRDTQIRREAFVEAEKYRELLLAVENKYEGETRHETALRLIKQSQQTGDSKQDAQEGLSDSD